MSKFDRNQINEAAHRTTLHAKPMESKPSKGMFSFIGNLVTFMLLQ
jgi:hypothetical protein